ncbi:hypothetical protein ACFL4O_03885, partial [bacterium]
MKTKLLLFMVVVFMLNSLSYAEKLSFENFQIEKTSIKTWAGYTTVNMDAFNKELDNSNYSSVTKAENGIIMGIDLNYEYKPNITVGPRISYLKVNQPKFEYNLSIPYVTWDWTTYSYNTAYYTLKNKAEYDLSLVPIMVGACYNKDINKEFCVNIGADVGVGFGYG